MWELDHKEDWVPKNWCFWTMVLEKTPGSPLDCEIKLVNPKENQSWIFIGRTDAEAEALVLWPTDKKSWWIRKDWCWEKLKAGGEGGKMFGWHHRLNGHEFEKALGDGEGRGSLECCSSWGCKVSDKTDQLSNNSNYAKKKPVLHSFKENFCAL